MESPPPRVQLLLPCSVLWGLPACPFPSFPWGELAIRSSATVAFDHQIQQPFSVGGVSILTWFSGNIKCPQGEPACGPSLKWTPLALETLAWGTLPLQAGPHYSSGHTKKHIHTDCCPERFAEVGQKSEGHHRWTITWWSSG